MAKNEINRAIPKQYYERLYSKEFKDPAQMFDRLKTMYEANS